MQLSQEIGRSSFTTCSGVEGAFFKPTLFVGKKSEELYDRSILGRLLSPAEGRLQENFLLSWLEIGIRTAIPWNDSRIANCFLLVFKFAGVNTARYFMAWV